MLNSKNKYSKLYPGFEPYNYLHSICIFFAFAITFYTLFFFKISIVRTFQACNDLLTSLGYYCCTIFKTPFNVSPTILIIPKLDNALYSFLPFTFVEFKVKLYELGLLLINKQNLYTFFIGGGYALIYVIMFLVMVIPFIISCYLVARVALNRQNNDYDKDTKPLKCFKFLSKNIYVPLAKALKIFLKFVRNHKFYIKIWLVLLLFNFNILTVGIEALAFVIYFVCSIDVLHIYTIVYKIFLDLSVVIRSVPLWVFGIIAFYYFDKFRKNIAYSRLRHYENYDKGFINSLPIVSMVCGTMGKKKTTMLTDMALSQQIIFRDKAFEKILENDLKFPYFPFINLENAIKQLMQLHNIYSLATCKCFVWHCADLFYNEPCAKNCFDYDFERYGLTYNDGLKVVDLFQIIEIYSQLYFIYIMQSSLLISNYSIRTDSILQDLGNFPIWNNDFFKRDSRLINAYSRHSHILDFDMLRLGRKVLKDNYASNAFEFGVLVITEGGKERGNMVENKGLKKESLETNQLNDGFNSFLKMVRHSSTIDNFPFVKVLIDEQRPMSMGADIRELCDVVHIRNTSDMTLSMPFFFVETLLYNFVFSKFKSFYVDYRFNRADNSLYLHLVKTIVGKFYNYYAKINNTFSFCKLDLQLENGTIDGAFDNHKYFLCTKKIYSNRFSTDCFSDYFVDKSLNSAIGINDLCEYQSDKATFDELKQQNSYFINDLLNWRS